MDLDWEKLVKRYVWDPERTPYFVRVTRLSRTQAQYELFTYSLFVGVLFAVLTVATLSNRLPHGDAAIVPIYVFTVLCAAVLLGLTRHQHAAAYCAGAPLAALAYFAVYGFHPGLAPLDRTVLVVVVVAWFGYALRTVAIAKRYPELGGGPDAE